MTLEEAIQSTGFNSQAHKAAINVMYVAYMVKTQVSLALKAFNLTPEQYNVLRILKGKHPDAMCVKDIAGRMIERNSNVPRIIDRLEAKFLVSRHQSDTDRRETIIEITESGLDLLEKAYPVMVSSNAGLSSMSEADLKQLNHLLDRYLNT